MKHAAFERNDESGCFAPAAKTGFGLRIGRHRGCGSNHISQPVPFCTRKQSVNAAVFCFATVRPHHIIHISAHTSFTLTIPHRSHLPSPLIVSFTTSHTLSFTPPIPHQRYSHTACHTIQRCVRYSLYSRYTPYIPIHPPSGLGSILEDGWRLHSKKTRLKTTLVFRG